MRNYCETTKLIELDLEADSLQVSKDKKTSSLLGNPLKRLEQLLQAQSQWETEIVLGKHRDPLHPFSTRFELALKAIEQILEKSPQALCIRTSSPLIVLALPLLKKRITKIRVQIPVESELEQRIKPELKSRKLSERVEAVKTLRSFGIQATLCRSLKDPTDLDHTHYFSMGSTKKAA